MLMYNKNMGMHLEEEQKGFTIIEVMLFLALSGFLLVGILAGTGSSIANQRYKDAVQDAADALRSAYSFVADTQVETRDKKQGACGGTVEGADYGSDNEANLYRGRTTCAVYGAVVMIDGNRIQTTTVIGRDYFDFVRAAQEVSAGKNVSEEFAEDVKVALNPTSDLALLKALHVNNLAYQCGTMASCKDISVPGGSKVQRLKWDTIFKAPRSAEQSKNEDLKLTLLIYRSPVNGVIRTISMSKAIEYNGKVVDYAKDSFTSLKDQGIYQFFENDAAGNPQLTQKDLYLCIDSNGAESYADHRRIIKITRNAHSQSGVILLDMDEEAYYDSPTNTDPVLCDDK